MDDGGVMDYDELRRLRLKSIHLPDEELIGNDP